MVTQEQIEFFADNGYVVVPQLFTAEEVEFYREHFMALRAQGPHPHDLDGVDVTDRDPLKRFPRMLHMHHWDEVSRRWLLDDRLRQCWTALLGQEPFAVQSMLYFKPPGARGQAPHQDNFYLAVKPGTCGAAWLALDRSDEENGCMCVVPGSHKWPLLCTEKADTKISFTDVGVPLPEGVKLEPVVMEAGDVLFFHGSLVHGSFPNKTTGRFRRSLIGHYIEGNSEQVSEYDKLVLRFDGSEVNLHTVPHAPAGGRCGRWVEENGTPVIELSGVEVSSAAAQE
jgi:ectoine hydroxylase-related dioxygenase (phytanoyl-CoA dioxygenase family)